MEKFDLQKEQEEVGFIFSRKNNLMRPVLCSITDEEDVCEQELHDELARLRRVAIRRYNGGKYIGSHFPLSSGNIITVLYKVDLE
ncbi:hypothetical protein [Bacteroides congonensis]